MSKSTCVKSENVKSKHVDALDAFSPDSRRPGDRKHFNRWFDVSLSHNLPHFSFILISLESIRRGIIALIQPRGLTGGIHK